MSERITVSTWLSEEQARQLAELVTKHNQDMQALAAAELLGGLCDE
jgi:hypothetical protein